MITTPLFWWRLGLDEEELGDNLLETSGARSHDSLKLEARAAMVDGNCFFKFIFNPIKLKWYKHVEKMILEKEKNKSWDQPC